MEKALSKPPIPPARRAKWSEWAAARNRQLAEYRRKRAENKRFRVEQEARKSERRAERMLRKMAIAENRLVRVKFDARRLRKMDPYLAGCAVGFLRIGSAFSKAVPTVAATECLKKGLRDSAYLRLADIAVEIARLRMTVRGFDDLVCDSLGTGTAVLLFQALKGRHPAARSPHDQFLALARELLRDESGRQDARRVPVWKTA